MQVKLNEMVAEVMEKVEEMKEEEKAIPSPKEEVITISSDSDSSSDWEMDDHPPFDLFAGRPTNNKGYAKWKRSCPVCKGRCGHTWPQQAE